MCNNSSVFIFKISYWFDVNIVLLWVSRTNGQITLVINPNSKEISFDEARKILTAPPALEVICSYILINNEGIGDLVSFVRELEKVKNKEENYQIYSREIDPIGVVELDPIGFDAFLNFELRAELHVHEVMHHNWVVFLDQGDTRLGEIKLWTRPAGTCAIMCECSEMMINLTQVSHRNAHEYWARPDAELINLPHEWSSYDHAYMMRNWLMEDLRKAGVLAD